MSMEFQWKENNIAEVRATVQKAAKRGLFLAGEHILGVSNLQAPHEDGDLERSGVVSEADGGKLLVAVSYDTPYAERQHENLNYLHDDGRNAKYLARAMKSESKTAGRIIQQSIKRAVG